MAIKTANRLHKLDWLHGIEFFEADYEDHVFGRHAHSGFAIGAISQGVGGYQCRGSSHVLPKGKLSLMNPEEPHTGYSVDGRLRYSMIYASEKAVADMLAIPRNRGFAETSPRDTHPEILTGMAELACLLTAKDGSGKLGIEQVLNTLLQRIFTCYAGGRVPAPGAEKKLVQRVAELIDAHVEKTPAEDLTIAQLAGMEGVSPNYLIQSFSREKGLSPRKYLIARKICRAKSMIADGLTSLETALALGFYDQAHFIRHFRNMTGVTPGRMVVHH